jgi:2-alkyl-3-oxoalkanoate reductase
MILITGAASFVGAAVVRALAGTTPLRLLLHQDRAMALLAPHAVRPRPALAAAPAGTDLRYGDLAEPATIEGLCDGVATVVHLANLVSPDEPRSRRVNEFGTRALLGQAYRAGVDRVLYLSPADAYGPIGSMVPVVSRRRPPADELVRAFGGLVLRPQLVYGTGDLWALASLISLLRTIGGLPDGGPALQSVIDVDDLAQIVAMLARSGWDLAPGQVFHACHPEPVSVAGLAATVAGTLGVDLPMRPVPLGQAGLRLGTAGVPPRELVRMTQSHWCGPNSIWHRVGLAPGPSFAAGLARHTVWYGGLGALGGLGPLAGPTGYRVPEARSDEGTRLSYRPTVYLTRQSFPPGQPGYRPAAADLADEITLRLPPR